MLRNYLGIKREIICRNNWEIKKIIPEIFCEKSFKKLLSYFSFNYEKKC